jgi:50S ribosomal subunit-associated GTPase HflX
MVPASENHLEERSSHNSVFISAEKKLNINRLREELLVEITKAHMQIFPNWLASEVYSGI